MNYNIIIKPMPDGHANRFNSGKMRYDLAPLRAQYEYIKVLMAGSKKYGDNNWQRGMPFTTVIASMERHLQALKKGEDYDEETGLFHAAHIMCNAAFLLEYYHIYPQGDDRIRSVNKIVAIDISVLFTSDGEYYSLGDIEDVPFHKIYFVNSSSQSDNDILEGMKDLDLQYFELIPEESLDESHENYIKTDVIVVDRYDKYIHYRNKNMLTYMLTTQSNKHHNVGHFRIESLLQLCERIC